MHPANQGPIYQVGARLRGILPSARQRVRTCWLAAFLTMMRLPLEACVAGDGQSLANADVESIKSLADSEYSSLFALYRHFHQHPELSLHEEQTGKRLAELLREGGYEVTANVGGHGVVALLRNGDGPT